MLILILVFLSMVHEYAYFSMNTFGNRSIQLVFLATSNEIFTIWDCHFTAIETSKSHFDEKQWIRIAGSLVQVHVNIIININSY